MHVASCAKLASGSRANQYCVASSLNGGDGERCGRRSIVSVTWHFENQQAYIVIGRCRGGMTESAWLCDILQSVVLLASVIAGGIDVR